MQFLKTKFLEIPYRKYLHGIFLKDQPQVGNLSANSGGLPQLSDLTNKTRGKP
jgi:hypothetical protein